MRLYLESSVAERAVTAGVGARTVLPGVQYLAFCDIAGGSGSDRFTCAVPRGGIAAALKREAAKRGNLA